MEPSVSWIHTIWVDAGFDGNPFMHWVIGFCRWIMQVVIRPCITLLSLYCYLNVGLLSEPWAS